ncbi:MAG: porin [Bdellovibrionales bacterium]
MKKLLLTTAACGLAFAATPANAQVQLELGGYFKGYGVFLDQDDATGTDSREFDFIRNTEIHFGGETTLDNGLTVGAHFEAETDADDGFNVDESYLYFSGNWGRVNAGAEDGAAYLLQVAAPSADSNIDGIRQFVQPVNFSNLEATGLTGANISADNDGGLDYDLDPTGKSDKLTYLSPILNGFQIGASFSAETDASNENSSNTDDGADDIGSTYEIAVRYEGQFNNVGVIAGAGYSHGDNENESATGDDREAFNLGLDLDIGPFGLGAVYTEDNGARDGAGNDDEETIVIGADYTTGPFKLGVSYLNIDNLFAVEDAEVDRYSGGVTYTYGPGMTFRGSIGFVDAENAGGTDADATYITLGTQVNF